MKGLILLVSAAALTLAGTCLYLSSQVRAEREQRLAADARAARLAAEVEKLQSQRLASAANSAAEPSGHAKTKRAVTAPAPAVQTGGTLAPGEERFEGFPERKLFANASGRALLRADTLASLRSRNPELAQRVNLTEAENQKLLELLADQELRRRAGSRSGSIQDAAAQDQKEIEVVLGKERARVYEEYKKGAPDRQQVRSLRSRLGEVDAMTDDQATTLASALQEEREQFGRELKEQFGDRGGFTMGTVTGGVFRATGGIVDEDRQERDVVDQMKRYNQRMQGRASSVLNTRQLKVFTEMQDAQLAQQRVFLRSMRETVPSK